MNYRDKYNQRLNNLHMESYQGLVVALGPQSALNTYSNFMTEYYTANKVELIEQYKNEDPKINFANKIKMHRTFRRFSQSVQKNQKRLEERFKE